MRVNKMLPKARGRTGHAPIEVDVLGEPGFIRQDARPCKTEGATVPVQYAGTGFGRCAM